MRKSILFSLLCFVVASAAIAAPLSQNDISILMPMPDGASVDLLWQPSTKGAFGELLPVRVYDFMPSLGFETPEEMYPNLRVVGIRLDPCFVKVDAAPTDCQSQIRMVWQPWESDLPLRFQDVAIHTFYDVPNADFPQLIAKLEALKDKYQQTTQDEAVGVNPMLKRQGLGSAYAKELFEILLAQVGESRMSQATFMKLSGAGNIWIFGGLVVSGTVINPLPIPRIKTAMQTFTNNPNTLTPTYFASGSIRPVPTGADTVGFLTANSSLLAPKDEPQIIESTMSAFRIENPRRHDTNSMDCVSCHVAQPARVWATRQYPWLVLEYRGKEFAFQSKLNLKNESPNQNNTTIVRAFGYFRADPAISQRTINETAAVLEKLYPPATPRR